MTLAELNARSDTAAVAVLEGCCAAASWTKDMTARRPFRDLSELLDAADRCFDRFRDAQWMEAFAGHPRIGDLERLRELGDDAERSRMEQSGVASASDEVLRELAQANTEYERKFGFVFLVCARGRTASELLSALEERMGNSADLELKLAANELRKITRLRLEDLIEP